MTPTTAQNISLNDSSLRLLETACHLEDSVTPSQLLNYLVQNHLREDVVRKASASVQLNSYFAENRG